ncbi:hypothetical protein F5X98DRAFT_362402 [Xylaria grammica]|nr:hypothetical protein F5X98DRAFT_362402 [Xylaria grammica]
MAQPGLCTEFPAPGHWTQQPRRFRTNHGDHRDIMLGGIGAQNIFHSSDSNAIEVTNNVDLGFTKQKPSLHIPNGCVMRMTDFSPGAVSTMHRWRNMSNAKPARMLFTMLDVKPIIVNSKALEFDVGELMKESAEYKDGEGPTRRNRVDRASQTS